MVSPYDGNNLLYRGGDHEQSNTRQSITEWPAVPKVPKVRKPVIPGK